MSGTSDPGRGGGSIPAPPGQHVNLVDPPNHNASIIGLHTFVLIVGTLCVGMRIYTRAVVLRQFGWDDSFCIIGWMFAIVFCASIFKDMTYGLGYHLWDLPKPRAIEFAKWELINECVTTMAWAFIKLAFFWSYKRIFTPRKDVKWLCYIGAFICTAFYIAMLFHDIFICVPVQKGYDRSIPGHCLPPVVGGADTAIFNTISDLYVLVLPMPFLFSLQMGTARKLRLVTICAVGVFVNACSITRLVLTFHYAHNKDASMNYYIGSIWLTLEIYVGLISVSLLVLPAYWSRVLLPSWSSLKSRSMGKLTRKSRETDRTASDSEGTHELIQFQKSGAASAVTIPQRSYVPLGEGNV